MLGKGKKMYGIMALLLTAALTLTACTSEVAKPDNTEAKPAESASDESSKRPMVGACMVSLTGTFLASMIEGGDKAGEDYGVDVNWQSGDGSLEKQISIIDNFILQGVDVIFVDPVDAKGILPAIKKCSEAGIPIVTIANKVEGAGNYNTLYPDFENFQTVARVMATLCDKEGEIAYLAGSPGNWCGDERDRGFKETIEKEFPDMKIVGIQPTYFDTANAQKAVETWLNNYPGLKGIGYTSDFLGLVGISVSQSMGKELFWTGCDGDAEMAPYINDGTCQLDILTGGSRVGYWNVAVCARILSGEEMPIDMFMKTYFVMSDETHELLTSKGLEVEYITPAQGDKILTQYSEEFGPQQDKTVITGVPE